MPLRTLRNRPSSTSGVTSAACATPASSRDGPTGSSFGSEILWGAGRIETDEGAWQEVPRFTLDFDRGPGSVQQHIYVGEDGYAGLIAVANDTWQSDDADATIVLEGFILDGGMLPDPEPYYP